MIQLTESTRLFREKLNELSRNELLDVIRQQDPTMISQIARVEYVFEKKLTHLRWPDGTPVEGRILNKEELIRLIDPPFIHSANMEKMGFTEDMQRQIHIATDPVLWAKYYLGAKPRLYQILPLRDLHPQRVLRFGRRLGKSWMLATYMLWFCYTNNKVNVIVVAPMKTHVSILYDAVLELVEGDDALPQVKEAIERHVASPQYEINFKNGSNIKLFSTGVKSDNKSVATRGQEANMIIADEMDYMGVEDLNALYAMLMKTDDKFDFEKILIGASTPTGLRNTFWSWSTDKEQDFHAYWFPSTCSLLWDKKTERRMHIQYPDPNVYRQEIEADWGEPAEGVYPREYVDLTFKHNIYNDDGKLVKENEWEYKVDRPSARSEFVMGVDWDKVGAGVNVIVLEICHSDYEDSRFAGKIKLAYREEITKGEFTYTYAVERIQELSSVFRPKHIYVDRGAGETQVELLHKYGLENPSSRLHETVKGLQFAQSIEMMDPFTQQKVKKKLKNFMVDNLYKMFQSQVLAFPGHDDELYLQIISYVVKKQNDYGEPIYSPGPGAADHAHDALILACYAIADNYDSLLNPIFASKSISVSNQAFLPLFSIDNAHDEVALEQAQDAGIEVPVFARRSMSRNMRGGKTTSRGNFGNSRTIKRKMF